MYVLGTAAMLVALPHDTVSITNGMPQATAALVERLGAGWLAPVAAIVAILLDFVTPADEASPWLYRGKVIGGVVGFMLLGVLLAGRRVRHDTAPPASPA